jgi:hypothetical protein
VKTEAKTRSIAGTVFSDGKPRFIQIKGINIDAEIGAHMLYTTNEDVPGIIGTLGQTMGENGVNIANFTLGRQGEGRRSRFSTSMRSRRRMCWTSSRPRDVPADPTLQFDTADRLRCVALEAGPALWLNAPNIGRESPWTTS